MFLSLNCVCYCVLWNSLWKTNWQTCRLNCLNDSTKILCFMSFDTFSLSFNRNTDIWYLLHWYFVPQTFTFSDVNWQMFSVFFIVIIGSVDLGLVLLDLDETLRLKSRNIGRCCWFKVVFSVKILHVAVSTVDYWLGNSLMFKRLFCLNEFTSLNKRLHNICSVYQYTCDVFMSLIS